ncbi:hypothetical protein [Euzebya tangerina]|uniref:hypothetical protein n=1 Tax=Euzebya tangerina TaxID=591198 RepID=UPI0013C36DE8|nr:hypothetical protein [Euzebya tangerina]
MSVRRLRAVLRALHLVPAVALVLYVYTPLADVESFRTVVQIVSVPLLGLTGLALWQAPRILARRRRRAAEPR